MTTDQPTFDLAANPGARLILEERVRQVTREGWTPEHDDEHDSCELVVAAVEYVQHAMGQVDEMFALPDTGEAFPWDARWWKPADDPVRNLVKAGALIAAEIDRLLRRSPGD